MRKTAIKICGLSLVLGIFGAFFRWLQNVGAFDAETLLATPGAWQSWVMAAYILAAAVCLYFIVKPVREMSIPDAYPANILRPHVFYTAGAGFIAVLMAVGGLLLVIGSKSYTAQGLQNRMFVFDLLLGILAIAAAVCAFLLVFGAKKPKTKGNVLSIALVIFACFWLIATYKDSSNDPVIWHFALRILAVCATILGLYYFTGYSYEKPRAFPSVYFCLLGAVLNITVLADDVSMGNHLINAGTALLLLLLPFAMINNGDAVPVAAEEAPEAPTEE